MSTENRTAELVEREVTCTLFKNGKLYIVENVPARVNVETGEQFFSPKTVDNLQRIILVGCQEYFDGNHFFRYHSLNSANGGERCPEKRCM